MPPPNVSNFFTDAAATVRAHTRSAHADAAADGMDSKDEWRGGGRGDGGSGGGEIDRLSRIESQLAALTSMLHQPKRSLVSHLASATAMTVPPTAVPPRDRTSSQREMSRGHDLSPLTTSNIPTSPSVDGRLPSAATSTSIPAGTTAPSAAVSDGEDVDDHDVNGTTSVGSTTAPASIDDLWSLVTFQLTDPNIERLGFEAYARERLLTTFSSANPHEVVVLGAVADALIAAGDPIQRIRNALIKVIHRWTAITMLASGVGGKLMADQVEADAGIGIKRATAPAVLLERWRRSANHEKKLHEGIAKVGGRTARTGNSTSGSGNKAAVDASGGGVTEKGRGRRRRRKS